MKEKPKEKQKGKSFWNREGVQGYLFMILDRISTFVCISDVVFPLLCIL